jgi:hypothetical protein
MKRSRQIFVLIIVALYILQFSIHIPISSVVYQNVEANSSTSSQPMLYPTYQFSSWSGGGVGLVFGAWVASDADIQQQFIPTASLLFVWGGVDYANWCGAANTSTTRINTNHYGSGNIYSPSIAARIVRYQMPYLIQVPLDGYGSECVSWAQDVIKQFPDLMTADNNGTFLNSTYMSAVQRDYVRVDSLNFSKQVYNDLVNLYNNLKSTNPALIPLWHGLHIASIGADDGDLVKPGSNVYCANTGTAFRTHCFYWDNRTVADFALSPQCNVAQWCGPTGTLYQSIVNHSANATQFYKWVASNLRNQWDLWLDEVYFTALAYASYNFTHSYPDVGGGVWLIQTSYDYQPLPTSQYPVPFNSSYIKSLDSPLGIFNTFIQSSAAYVENGNPPTSQTVSSDESLCLAPWRSGYKYPSAFLASTASSALTQIMMNTMYLTPYCLGGASIISPGNIPYNNASSPAVQILTSYGTLLNRMQNVGWNVSAEPTLVKHDASTGVRVLGGNGYPLLYWLFTNSTAGDVVSFNASVSGSCIAISALTWQIVGKCNSAGSLVLSGIYIPPQGWNPIYVIKDFADGSLVYANMPLTSSNSTSWTFSAPHESSAWAIINLSSQPNNVYASNVLAPLQQYPSLAALNKSVVGWQYLNGQWINQTQYGWYYDSADRLLYVHFAGDKNVTISVQMPVVQTFTGLAVSLNSSSLSLNQGDNASVTANVVSYGNKPQQVSLSAIQVPSGVNISLVPSTGTGNFSVAVGISVSKQASVGHYSIGIEASAGSFVSTTFLNLSVMQPNGGSHVGNVTVSFASGSYPASQITVDGQNYAMPIAFTWPEGSNHSISVPNLYQPNDDTRFIFKEWAAGNTVIQSAGFTLTASANESFTAVYRPMYRVSLVIVDASGLRIYPQFLVLNISGTTVYTSQSSLWLNANTTLQLLYVKWLGTDTPVLNNGTVIIGSAGKIAFAVAAYQVAIKLMNALGRPVQYVNITLVTPGGVAIYAKTNQTGVAIFNSVPVGLVHFSFRYHEKMYYSQVELQHSLVVVYLVPVGHSELHHRFWWDYRIHWI